MTYKHETFWPGPNFNVTVGPNGSGKSSIVTALSIALGGDLSSLNRQTEIATLINTSSEHKQAIVEIELFVKEGKNMVITCILDSKHPPEWKLQGKPCSKKELADTVEQFQIQPGNLCQFLPQDVVRDFPNMKNQEIFYSTVKAIGDKKLMDDYNDLKGIEKDIKSIEDQKEMKEKTLENLERKETKLAEQRKVLQARREIQDRKITIENAIKWQKFKSMRTVVKETRDEERQLVEEIKKLEIEEAPIAKFLESYERKVARLKELNESTDKEYSASSNKIEEFEIVDEEDDLDNLAERERELESSEKNRVESKRRLSNEIAELKAQIQNTEVDPDIDKKIHELVTKRGKREEQLSRTEQNKSEVEFTRASINKEVEKNKQRRDNNRSTINRKLATLLKENKDAHDGVQWLRQNKNLFSKTVHEPIMLCLDVKSPEYAKLVETQIGKQDLEGFVCESPDDVNLLTKKLREELGLRRINAFHSDPDDYSKFVGNRKNEDLSRFDFRDYLSDMYDAPPAVQAYLCRQKKLHEIPYFATENQYSDSLKGRFKTYYLGNVRFNSMKSKYSGELSTGCEDISSRRVIRLSVTVDRDQEQQIANELDKKEKSLAQCEQRYNNIISAYNKINDDLAVMQKELTRLRAEKNIMAKLQSDLTMKEKTIANYQNPKGFDMKKEKMQIAQDKKKNVFALSQKMFSMVELVRSTIDKEVERRVLNVTYQNIESENSDNIEKKDRYKKELDAKRTELKEVQKNWEKQKQELQTCHSEARKATGILSEQVKYKPADIWSKRFELLGSSDENVLAALLDDCESELKHQKQIPDKIIDDIQHNQEKLDAARKEKTRLDQDMIKKTQEANRLKRDWISGVEKMVDKIDDRFGSMMAQLGYAGQISLSQGKRDIDFSSYGVSIKVRFRDGQEMQELSRGVQSGGEKSVTTAVYMMALQELTQVPFRCVDEINQGMDERNERLVWDQLLNVCRKYKAQYFYMAPKFPYSLPFDDQVTIVVCNNGAVSKPSHRSYRMKTFIEMAKRAN